MSHSLLSLHSYLIFNAALAVSYLLARFILDLPMIQQKISQSQRLKFSRLSFITAITAFFMLPYIMQMLPFTYQSTYQLEPILIKASSSLLQQQNIVSVQLNQIADLHSSLSVSWILIMLFSIGLVASFSKYIYSLYKLNKFTKNSFHQHKINQVKILFSRTIQVPFCWSLLKNHYIAIPDSFLEKNTDLKLAIRHELQHIRQGDTYWLHFLMLIKTISFWNPFMHLWIKWFDELQEYACDETIILRKKTSPINYAQCLVNTALSALEKQLVPDCTLGIHGLSQSILYRRVNMLFNYKINKSKKITMVSAYVILFLMAASAAYALNGSSNTSSLTKEQLNIIIEKSHLDTSFQVTATPEVINEINNILGSKKAKASLRESLQRMKQYQPFIEESLNAETMPTDLLAVPLVESGYRNLDQSKNRVLAAGIWQIIPTTAQHYGLNISSNHDERLDSRLSTKAALTYLKSNFAMFHNWKLAIIAYEIGEEQTDKLIQQTRSSNPWVLARSPSAPKELIQLIAMFDAELIIMHNPTLID